MAGEGLATLTLGAVDKTKAAFDSVKGNLQGLDGAADKVGAKFGSLGTLIAGAFAGVSFAAVTDVLDELDKLSEKSGVSVASLSALRFASESNSVSFETLSAGLTKLSRNMADAAGGSKEAQAKFQALGISLERLKTASPDEILLDISDKISSFADGANKSALAGEAFGKSIGPDLIPLLNKGRDGIAALTAEAKALGVVYDAQLAKAAADLNDNLRKLKFAAEGAATALGGGLIKSLADATTFLVEATEKAGRLQGLLITIGAGFAKLFKQDEIGELQSQAETISGEIARITNVLVGLSNVLARDPGNELAVRRYAFLSGKLKDLQDQAGKTSTALKVAADVAQFGDHPIDITKGAKPNAPTVDKSPKDTISEYEKLIKRIQERTAAEQQELELGRELTAGEKFRVDITQALAEVIAKLAPGERQLVETARDRVVSLIEQNDHVKLQKKLLEDQVKVVQQQTQDLLKQNLAQAEQNKQLQESLEEIGLSAEAIEALHQARLRAALATAEQDAAQAHLNATTAAEIVAADRRVELLRQEIDLRDKAAAKTKQIAQDASAGFGRAIDDFVKDAANIGDAVEKLTSSALHGLEDELTKLLTGQKTNFRSLVDSLIAEITRLYVIKPLLAGLFGGGTSSGFLAGLLGTVGSVVSGSYNADYSNEGLHSAGTSGLVGSSAAGNGRVSIQVVNAANATARTEQTTGPGGEKRIKVLVEEIVAGSVRAGGPVHEAMASTYGVNRAGSAPRF